MDELGFVEYNVSVDSPQKHLDPLETYISFRVITKIKSEEQDNLEFTVRRRYNDFLWLRNKLIETFPTLVVPALPAKHSVLEQLDRYSKEFIMARMVMLHSYLRRLATHPVFSCSPTLKTFLTAQSSQFCMISRDNPSILDKLTGSLQVLTGRRVRNTNLYPEFHVMKQYVNQLSQKLVAVQNVSNRIHEERSSLALALTRVKYSIVKWANIDQELSEHLMALSAAIGVMTSSQQTHLLSDHIESVDRPLEEYIAYVDAVLEALNRRDAIQCAYEISQDESYRRRVEKDELESQLEKSPMNGFGFKLWKISARDRVRKLQRDMPSLYQQVEDSHDNLQIANERLRSDLDRWTDEKKAEIKGIVLKLADRHVRYYQESLQGWEKALQDLKKN